MVKSLSNLKNVSDLRLFSKVPSSPWLFSNYGLFLFLISGVYLIDWRLIFKFIQTPDSNTKNISLVKDEDGNDTGFV